MRQLRTLYRPHAFALYPGSGARASIRYGTAVAAAVLALLGRLALDEVLGEESHPYVFLYIAVAGVAWFVGPQPAFVTLVLGMLVCLWIVVPPRNSLAVKDAQDLLEILVCLLVTITIVFLALLARLTQAAKQQAEALVQERTARLLETVEDLEHLSYALTHDMRAPLRAMHSYAQILMNESQTRTEEQMNDLCLRIMESAHRLDNLIQDSLNYTKILRHQLTNQTVDVGKLLKSIIESYPQLSDQAANIVVMGNLHKVSGNVALLTHALSNLLTNAVKFVSPGKKPRINIWTQRVGEVVRIYVEDNGIGIPEEHRSRIFGIFEQLNKERSGTGMGLAIVRKAVDRMGGNVNVESEPGKGSRFWIELPFAI